MRASLVTCMDERQSLVNRFFSGKAMNRSCGRKHGKAHHGTVLECGERCLALNTEKEDSDEHIIAMMTADGKPEDPTIQTSETTC